MSTGADLVIFHYNLSAGGVSAVIRLAAKAVREHGRSVSRIRIVTGSSPEPPLNDEPGASGPGKPPGPPGIPLESIVIPEIGYREAPRGRAFNAEARRLTALLTDRFASPDSVWWIHNHHLGKNPVFTQAILSVASSADAPRMILQPHDFPEAGRFSLLSALGPVTAPLYPTGSRIRWALINGRDREILRFAGIPEASLFFLPDPAPPVRPTFELSPSAIKTSLFPGVDPAVRTFLCPVRSIRRKNVLEAGLLSLVPSTAVRLVVTLPGTSRDERAYSSLVEGCFKSGAIRGEFAFGVRRPDVPLDQLGAACDCLVSGSIQEGFGYFFTQALQWGLPLLARRLDVLADLEDMFGDFPASFYDAFLFPMEHRERRMLERRYAGKLRHLRNLIPASAFPSIREKVVRALAGGLVDFSLLDAKLQAAMVARAAGSQALRASLREANADIAKSLDGLLSTARPQPREAPERFSLTAFAKGFDRLIASFDLPVPAVKEPRKIQEAVRAAFARLEYLTLLYD